MTAREKEKLCRAMDLLRTNEGYEPGMTLLKQLLNPSYRHPLEDADQHQVSFENVRGSTLFEQNIIPRPSQQVQEDERV